MGPLNQIPCFKCWIKLLLNDPRTLCIVFNHCLSGTHVVIVLNECKGDARINIELTNNGTQWLDGMLIISY